MNRITLGILAVVLIFGLISCATDSGNPVEDQSIVQAVEDAPAGPIEVESEPVWKLKQETVMSPDGTVDKNIEYEYDAAGRLLKITERDGRDELLYLRNYEYEAGLLIRQDMSDRYGLLTVTDYANNGEGFVVRETKTDAQGEVLSIVTFDYEDGLVVKSVAADGQGIPHLSAEYSYEGRTIVEVVYILPGGSEEARFVRTLEDGLAVSEQTVLPDGSVETAREFEYEDGRLVTEIHFAGTRETKRLRFEYDGDGNAVRETWSNRKGLDYEVVEKQWIQVEED